MVMRLLDPNKLISIEIGAPTEPNPVVDNLENDGEAMALFQGAQKALADGQQPTTEQKILLSKIAKSQKSLKKIGPGTKVDFKCLSAPRQLLLSRLAYEAQADPTAIDLDLLFELIAEAVVKLHIDGAPNEVTAKTISFIRPLEDIFELALAISNASGLSEVEEEN